MSNLFVNAVTYPFCASPGSHSLKWTEGPELPQEVTVELLISTNRKYYILVQLIYDEQC